MDKEQIVEVKQESTYGHSPVKTTCPFCRSHIVTDIRHDVGVLTWVLCFSLIFLGCVLGCCLIPCCASSTKDVVHTCPNCRVECGRSQRI